MAPILDVEALSVRFETDDGVVQAVDELSFHLDEREVLGIVGESGCGKSVSLMSLVRLLPPSAKIEGSASFGGLDLLNASPMIAAGIVTVACTSSVLVMFGRMCLKMIVASFAPLATAAGT